MIWLLENKTKQNKRKKKRKKLAENPGINVLTYRHLLIKYHHATRAAEFGPVAAESFDNKDAPMVVGIHSHPEALEWKFLVALHFYVKNQIMEKLKAW